MRLLLDQDVYAVTVQFLESLGHDVLIASDIGLSRATDTELIARARESRHILVTRDRDFGRLAFAHEISAGVLFLRMKPSTLEAVHRELQVVLSHYAEDELERAFVVIEAGRHRIRRLPEKG